MSTPAEDEVVALRHTFNNLLGKIMGAAELALDQPVLPAVRTELDTIIRLVEEGRELSAAPGRSEGAARRWSD